MNAYTAKAAGALKHAGKIAKKLQHSYIGTEHLLLGLVHESEGMAGRLLAKYDVTEKKIMDLVQQLIAPEGV